MKIEDSACKSIQFDSKIRIAIAASQLTTGILQPELAVFLGLSSWCFVHFYAPNEANPETRPLFNCNVFNLKLIDASCSASSFQTSYQSIFRRKWLSLTVAFTGQKISSRGNERQIKQEQAIKQTVICIKIGNR